jgi:hypothetical protein
VKFTEYIMSKFTAIQRRDLRLAMSEKMDTVLRCTGAWKILSMSPILVKFQNLNHMPQREGFYMQLLKLE